jgi:hypothetical protein
MPPKVIHRGHRAAPHGGWWPEIVEAHGEAGPHDVGASQDGGAAVAEKPILAQFVGREQLGPDIDAGCDTAVAVEEESAIRGLED